MTNPSGMLWLPGALGGHLWVSDHLQGFCRMDPVFGTTTFAINGATCNIAAVSPGQADFDPVTNSVYVPDNSTKSQGVWRLTFNPATERVGNAVLLAPGKGLASLKTSSVAYNSADGKLYVSFIKNGNVVRVTNPAGAAQTVESVGGSSDGKGILSLAFVGADLYLAEGSAITTVPNPVPCTGGCKAVAASGIPVPNHLCVACAPVTLTAWRSADGLTRMLFYADLLNVYRYTFGSGSLPGTFDTYSKSASVGGKLQAYQSIAGLGADPAGNLYIGDDSSLGSAPVGHLYEIAAGSAPDATTGGGGGGGGTIVPAPLTGALYGTGVSNPSGPIWIPGALGGHFWVSDKVAGFCRMDLVPGSTTYAINGATCARDDRGRVVTPAASQPAWDDLNQVAYVPDITVPTSNGVFRISFDFNTETVSTTFMIASHLGLEGNLPVAVALGPDGNLYVSFIKNGNVVKVTTPAGAIQTVASVGSSSNGATIHSLAFMGSDLYLAETGTVTRIVNATSPLCTGGCKGVPAGIGVTGPTALFATATDLFAANSTLLYRYRPAQGTTTLLSSSGTMAGAAVAFQGINGLGVDALGNVFVGDDASGGAAAGAGRIWSVAAPLVP